MGDSQGLNGDGRGHCPWPFDEAGLRESADRSLTRLWVAEEARRADTGKPFHLFGIMSLALMNDALGGLVVGLGLDYPGAPDGDPTPLIEVLGRHLLALAADRRKALGISDPRIEPPI